MGDESISIRKLEQADMADVIELLQSMSEFRPPINDYPHIWENLCRQTNVHSIVAIIDENIVGYGSVVFEIKIRGGKMGHIEDIVSHPNYRKKGIGKAILDALFDVAKASGCHKVALQCQEHNVEFYKKCNYEISGVTMQRFMK
ncbi:GNAT family N-acetyltransferase [Nisaea sediminum]|uniref:GNAT family N-acetyltransferase n=1 Tax=Nisaea sediminum TaxID=2775867 RepID=UPI001865E64A|nr:GNAT family N-acetyltransferase [Nisaea sediminum]